MLKRPPGQSVIALKNRDASILTGTVTVVHRRRNRAPDFHAPPTIAASRQIRDVIPSIHGSKTNIQDGKDLWLRHRQRTLQEDQRRGGDQVFTWHEGSEGGLTSQEPNAGGKAQSHHSGLSQKGLARCMYDAVADDYCYPGTTVLKNKLDLTDADELAAFEAEVSDARADEEAPAGGLDYAHFKAMHRHLFQDVYDWACEPAPCASRKTTACSVIPRTSRAKRRSCLRS